jgi:hypothetical protein
MATVDIQRFGGTIPQILASHEDYTTVVPLQKFRKPAVITQLRDPVDRVLSAYEFAGERIISR